MPRRLRLRSLRSRLFVMIIAPLALVALISSLVLHWMARDMSRNLYDDTLRVVAHAVARESVLSGGNILPEALLRSLVGAIGGPIYYQVVVSGGVFVAGYSDPPPLPEGEAPALGAPLFYDAVYRGEPVRVVALQEQIVEPEVDGWTTVRVWQTIERRQELSMTMLVRSAVVLALLVAAASVLVWIGIRLGLAPLMRLREAVALRTTNDLRPIRRSVPPEAAPLVATINQLFGRLADELERRNSFISNAAHQLRNPVAAIQAQAESALAAGSDADRSQRLGDLALAARRLSRMSQQLLRLEDASDRRPETGAVCPPVDFAALVGDVARRHVPEALRRRVDVALEGEETALPVRGNPVLLEEAVDNLIDNALRYGCPAGSELVLRLGREAGTAVLRVIDQGPGIPPELSEKVFGRFVRLSGEDDGGSGLGLPIVRAIIGNAGGTVAVELPRSAAAGPAAAGCVMAIRLPLAEAG